MMPALLTAAIALVALILSLHKERVLGPGIGRLVRAIRLHHAAQAAVVAISFWAALDADRESRRLRLAHLDAQASAAAAAHAVPIMDLYFLRLLPAAPYLKNYAGLESALAGSHRGSQMDIVLERASPGFARQRAGVLSDFSELQRIARTVLAESAVYGDRYPAVQVAWAKRTLELKASDLAALFNDTPVGKAYADLTGKCVGFSTAAARVALAQIEK